MHHVPPPLNHTHGTPQQARAGLTLGRYARSSARRCCGAASRNLTETAGLSLVPLARKCCATWFRRKP